MDQNRVSGQQAPPVFNAKPCSEGKEMSSHILADVLSFAISQVKKTGEDYRIYQNTELLAIFCGHSYGINFGEVSEKLLMMLLEATPD